MEAFFERTARHRYRATELTRGPWDPRAQHAGPPSALLGGVLDAALEGTLARITIEILRPVPIAELVATADVVRPGRSVRLAEATLADGDGPVLLARGWAIEPHPLDLPAGLSERVAPASGPGDGAVQPFFDTGDDVGYHSAMEFRFVRGTFREPGAATAWTRPLVPIVAGEPVRPLQRVLVAADSGNGISSVLPWREWLFINTDLTVALHRHPVGEWVLLDAATEVEAHGVGLARSELWDAQGPLGRGLQSLLVARR